MKVRIFLAVLAVIVAIICLYVFKPDLFQSLRERLVFFQVEAPPMKRLTDFVDASADKIFAPLDRQDALMPAQEIKRIREDLAEMGNAAAGDARQMYAAAVTLCDMMLEAVSAREEQAQRLDRLEDSQFQATLAAPGDRDSVIREKRAQFKQGILSKWEKEAEVHRDALRIQYAKLRGLELAVNRQAGSIRLDR